MTNNEKHGAFRAFRNRNYTLFFCGQSVSQIGTWMQRTAVSWVVYSLTHSAFMLGLSVFAQQFPSFLLSLYGGIVSDRYSRYKILLVTQTASMIQAVLLAALVLTQHYSVWGILSLSVVLGIINAFDTPARQPMVHDMVNDKNDIANALALNSAMVNIARLTGPALSGIILQSFGAGVCFALNALSFLAVLASLLLMRLPKFTPPQSKKKVFTELAEGFSYLKQTPAIGLALLIIMLLGLLVLPYDTLMPVFAKTVFKGNAGTFGYITSFVGLGAIAGSMLLASLKKGTDLRKVLIGSIAVLGTGLILFSRINTFHVAIPFCIIIGFASLMPMTAGITIVQTESAPHMRGRVMSYVALGYFGMLPFGSLLTGTISQKISAPATMLLQGIIAIVISFIFWRLHKTNKKRQKDVIETEQAEATVIASIDKPMSMS
ncbi:MFS transporter [Danxiaibacter flavus]|uniref:MFS transporter n=1 Tax=Danxiaibacter flavus TaxID=3049108 RepID=A0ABV3ZI89_9BACT|nr:MFS transporter [Chitinophagaceae bacterium DXS]